MSSSICCLGKATLGREPTVEDMGGSFQIIRARSADEVREKLSQDIYNTGMCAHSRTVQKNATDISDCRRRLGSVKTPDLPHHQQAPSLLNADQKQDFTLDHEA